MPLRCYSWSPADTGERFQVNFGDDLFPAIAGKLSSQRVQGCGLKYRGPKLLIGGSIIGLADNGDAVWGAGLRDGRMKTGLRRLKVYAVRGPLTERLLRQRGIETPGVLGDPAILLGRLFPEWKAANQEWRVGIIPHFREVAQFQSRSLPSDCTLISPLQSGETVVRQLTRCAHIVASSLHGIICAEAYGIPATPFRMARAGREPDFKYQDYYASTGRDWSPAPSWEKAAEQLVAPVRFPELDLARLQEAFPLEQVMARSYRLG